ncbi:MAG: HAD family hydrolase [Ornithinimicrobium sp.]|uniref:HAD family hydrolase n=1 Tax=Ornithinimicrobium sp. TaxID=1977084 RepID=UPI003D9B36F4
MTKARPRPAAFDAVVFDLGNVLVGWDPAGALTHDYTPEQIQEFFDAVDFPALNRRQDAGRPWAKARAEVAASAPHCVPYLDAYVTGFPRTLTGPIPGSADIVRDVHRCGARTLGLTNWSAELFEHAVPAAPVIGELEQVLVSGEVGLVKPDPAIFTLALDRFGLDPARTVFVDDQPANTDAAARLGFSTVTFTDSPALRAQLTKLGALPAD